MATPIFTVDRTPASVREHDPIQEVVRRLRDTFEQRASAGHVEGRLGPDDRLAALRLADAALRYSLNAHPRPMQIAVMGPTQTGKSTVVNLLCESEVAEVSPLAGFTVHAHGFWGVSAAATECKEDWALDVFPEFHRCAPEEVTRSDLAQYTLTRIDMPRALTRDDSIVVWDSPDFDSLAAGAYQHSLLELIALSDLHVIVVSKEKYSDLSAWRMLRLVQPLRRPLVVVLNKVGPDAGDAIRQSLQARFAELGGGLEPGSIHTIDYVARADQAVSPELHEAGRRLQNDLAARLADSAIDGPPARRAGALALVRQHWSDWTAPLVQEHAALSQWHDLVQSAIAGFVSAYRRDYLDHPQRNDSFRRAAIELLHLLEIPRLSGWLTYTRKVITWPIRQVVSSGKTWIRSRTSTEVPHALGAEATVLSQAIDSLLLLLQRDVARRSAAAGPGAGVWLALDEKLRHDAPRLSAIFEQAIAAHHESVQQAIHSAANSLYEELRNHPARLAALRAARATIDVGSLLLVVKTGGLHPMDALWAPATFALTSFLTEGMAGLQMGHVAKSLRNRQLDAVQSELAQGVLARELNRMAEELRSDGIIPVSPDELRAAAAALETEEGRL